MTLCRSIILFLFILNCACGSSANTGSKNVSNARSNALTKVLNASKLVQQLPFETPKKSAELVKWLDAFFGFGFDYSPFQTIIGDFLGRGLMEGHSPAKIAQASKLLWPFLLNGQNDSLLLEWAAIGFSVPLKVEALERAYQTAQGFSSQEKQALALLEHALLESWEAECIDSVFVNSSSGDFQSDSLSINILDWISRLDAHPGACKQWNKTERASGNELEKRGIVNQGKKCRSSQLLSITGLDLLAELNTRARHWNWSASEFDSLCLKIEENRVQAYRPDRWLRAVLFVMEAKKSIPTVSELISEANTILAKVGTEVRRKELLAQHREIQFRLQEPLNWSSSRKYQMGKSVGESADQLTVQSSDQLVGHPSLVNAELLKNSWESFLEAGTPYRYGGYTRQGADCSGLIWTCFREQGLLIPRTSRQLYHDFKNTGHLHESKLSLKPGDLLFFRSAKGYGISHVGIYIGQDRFLHCLSGQGVCINSLSERRYAITFSGWGRIQ